MMNAQLRRTTATVQLFVGTLVDLLFVYALLDILEMACLNVKVSTMGCNTLRKLRNPNTKTGSIVKCILNACVTVLVRSQVPPLLKRVNILCLILLITALAVAC